MESPHNSRHGEDNVLVHRSAISGFKNQLANIHDLPYEVLAHVFRLYIGEERHHQLAPYFKSQTIGAFPLGAVCQTWRSIAWTDHCLWTSLTFFMREKTTKMHVQLATEWLGRSGKLPLCIYLYGSSKITESLLFPLMDVIDQLLDRCDELGLFDLGSLALSRLSSGHRSATALESLKISSIVHLDDVLDFSSAAPTDLFIRCMDLTHLLLDWSALTVIEVENMFVDQALQILSLAPQLEYCQFEDVTDRQMELQQGYKSIVCTELKEIHLCSIYDDKDGVITTIFQAVTIPKLTTCDITYDQHFSTAIFLDFLSRSCCPITRLSLDKHGLSGEDLILIAEALPSIIHLSLGTSRSSPNDILSANPFFNALCLDSRYGNIHSTSGVLLPKLEDLTVATCVSFPWECLSGFRWRCHYSDDGTRTIEHGRPQLRSISIQCKLEYDITDKLPFYSDDEASAIFISDDLTYDWQTFSELLELGTNVRLALEVEMSCHQKKSLFSLMYRRLEDDLGRAPDHIIAAMNDYERATKKNVV